MYYDFVKYSFIPTTRGPNIYWYSQYKRCRKKTLGVETCPRIEVKKKIDRLRKQSNAEFKKVVDKSGKRVGVIHIVEAFYDMDVTPQLHTGD